MRGACEMSIENKFVGFFHVSGSGAWICQSCAWNCQSGAWISHLDAWICLLDVWNFVLGTLICLLGV